MRKHDVRKWIHAVLDMLPLFIIPIFAIYMHRHQVTDYTAVANSSFVADFNQVALNGNFDGRDNWSSQYYDVSFDNDSILLTSNSTGNSQFYQYVYMVENHKYICKASISKVYFDDLNFRVGNVFSSFVLDNDSIYSCQYIYTPLVTGQTELNYYAYYSQNLNGVSFYPISCYCIDLTHMFGSGNEPTIEQFNTWFPNDYYEYTLGTDVVIDNYSQVTYNDTDIGSQFVYALYKPIDKYFNFNKVATFNNMYQWITTNFFNGEVPLVVPIVWNIILYEFIMDVLFLIYAVFMFIIDFVECLIDKAFGKSYRGGR